MGKIQLRQTESAESAAQSNAVFDKGEPAVIVDTGEIRIGNGVDQWADLPSAAQEASTQAYDRIVGEVLDPASPIRGELDAAYATEARASSLEEADVALTATAADLTETAAGQAQRAREMTLMDTVRAAMTGGGNLTCTTVGVAWEYRFITLGVGRNTLAPSGYWVIDQPPDGTVIPVYNKTDVQSVTVTNGLVPLDGWDTLYYEIPFGATLTSKPGNFRIVQYVAGEFEVPHNWVMVVKRTSDSQDLAGTHKWGTGVYTDYRGGVNASLRWPITIAHRNAPGVYPEASWEGINACAETGYMIEVDVRRLSDGTLALCHDSTVTRTMDGITGNVSSATAEQWRKARIKPAILGGTSGTPVFFTDLLDKWGGRVPMLIEVKDDTALAGTIRAITERGLKNSVWVQAFTWATAVALAKAGLVTGYLSTTTPTQTPAEIKAAGIQFLGTDSSKVPAATVTAMKAAGIKTLGYTINNAAALAEAKTKGLEGFITDDPWFLDDTIPVRSSDPYDLGIRPPGLAHSRLAAPVPGTSAIFLSGRAIALGGTDDSTIRNITCPWAGRDLSIPVRIQMDLTFGSSSSTDTSNLGFWLGSIPASEEFPTDLAKAGQNAFAIIVRKSGILNAYQIVNGAAPAVVLTSTATAPYARVWTESTVQLVVKFTSSLVRVTVNAGQQSLYGDFVPAINPTGMRLWLRAVGTSGEFSDIRISNPYL